MTGESHGRFRRWFWRPPRAHGEIIADRQVSVLELFYDLVYVAVLGQAAHLSRWPSWFCWRWSPPMPGHDPRTPAGTSWLLAGAVALGLMALILTEQALADAERLSVVFHPLRLALGGGAAAALLAGWLRPAPWLLVVIFSAVWVFAVSRFLRADAWSQPTVRLPVQSRSSF